MVVLKPGRAAMRRGIACLGLLLVTGLLVAAGRMSDPSPAGTPPTAQAQADADNYAQQLFYLTTDVMAHYVRPVSRVELLDAALRGLYEAARVPVPAGLPADLRKAASDQQLLLLLSKQREQLGDSEPIRGPNALLVSCRAMTRALDPYSTVVSGEALRRGSGVDEQYGVGIELEANGGVGPLIVQTVLPGSPAQQAGIRPGDEIVEVDGSRVKGNTSAQAALLLNQGALPVNSTDVSPPPVQVTLRRPGGGAPRKLTLERRDFVPETVLGVARQADNSWQYLADRPHQIAHVRIAGLGNGTALEVRQVVGTLREGGLRGLILDLRWCPGGYLREAVNVAALFLGDCTVATIKNRGEQDTTYPSTAENKFLDFPVVVLVNGDTSGGAELIAAALQDHGRALVAGQRTLGKASIQTVLGLAVPDAGLKLTSGTFVRPSGKNLHRFPNSKPGDDWGVRPDPKAECRVSPELNRQLKEWWLQQTLRPGSSKEALPLDDPGADPQRETARQALLGMLK
jgi:C-terminal peptidase prc